MSILCYFKIGLISKLGRKIQKKLFSVIMILSDLQLGPFLSIIDLQNEQDIYFKRHLQRFPFNGISFVPTNVSEWALKIPPLKMSRYFGTCECTLPFGHFEAYHLMS